jgi:hypothetical protein
MSSSSCCSALAFNFASVKCMHMLISKRSTLSSVSALCNEDANGNVPLGKSCNRYWNCQGGYPRLQRCPAQLVFDRHSLRCVVPPTEECDIPVTPAPEADQQEGPDNRGQVSCRRGDNNRENMSLLMKNCFSPLQRFDENEQDAPLPPQQFLPQQKQQQKNAARPRN